MNGVGFCVVGLGMGRSRAKLVTETPGARLVSVVDLDQDRARDTGETLGCRWTTSLAEALQDDSVDVVMVMTPSGLHLPIAIEALQAGRHVITTKPMEVTLDRCDQMLEAAQKAGKLLAVDFQERFSDTPQKIKHALVHGLFGTPILGEARLKWYRSQEYYDQGGWRGTWKMDGGGALANQTIHNIDLLVWFMGPARKVTGCTSCVTHTIETEDLGMAMIQFASGAQGTILGTTTFPTSAYWTMEIHGSEGGVLADLSKDPKWIFLEGLEHRDQQLQRLSPHRNSVEDMVSAIRNGTALLCDGREGRMSIELLDAVYRSARAGGHPVEVGDA